jgi:hypothetical protein
MKKKVENLKIRETGEMVVLQGMQSRLQKEEIALRDVRKELEVWI